MPAHTPQKSTRSVVGGRSGPGRMDLIASVSRSSGMEKGGDALKDYKVQEEYRLFIKEKLDAFWERYPLPRNSPESELDAKKRIDVQENLLILFRKLREGLVSSNRKDQFALEIFETSLYLSIIFSSPRQTNSILSHLSQDLYEPSQPPLSSLQTTLITLLFHLVSHYPSQGIFHERLDSIPSSFLPQGSKARTWITSLALATRTLNYAKLEELTLPESFSPCLFTASESQSSTEEDLPRAASNTLILSLRAKSREQTWSVIRCAYRELPCHEGSRTKGWLVRSLCLANVNADSDGDVRLEEWLEEKGKEGHVRRKEGVQGRWIICKVR